MSAMALAFGRDRPTEDADAGGRSVFNGRALVASASCTAGHICAYDGLPHGSGGSGRRGPTELADRMCEKVGGVDAADAAPGKTHSPIHAGRL